jgi:hypothetical protein
VLANAIGVATEIRKKNKKVTPVLSLRHLAYCSNTDYTFLRNVVERRANDAYRLFRIKKRLRKGEAQHYRLICVPSPDLLRAQRWIVDNILIHAVPHESSVAFSKGSKLVTAAENHCSCRWLIKMDVRNFFESINEISAYRVFRTFGFQSLVAFELARLCTRIPLTNRTSESAKWRVHPGPVKKIKDYTSPHIGNLPQGAPTSPMLANLACYGLDLELKAIADKLRMNYTRYADDIVFSTEAEAFSRVEATDLIGLASAALGRSGLSPNIAKTRVVPPRARKIVLGLLVNSDVPRLSRSFKDSLRMHIHYLLKPGVGPTAHASRRGFASVAGLRNHLLGLVAYAGQVEPAYAEGLKAQLASVEWPV